MKLRKYKYILFLFAKHKEQDDFVTEIAEEISLLVKCGDIKFYYGPEASVFTFSTEENLSSVSEFVDIILSEYKAVYFLLPYNTDNVSFNLPKNIENHLFGDVVPDKKTDFNFLERKLFDIELLSDDVFEEILDQYDNDDDEISKLIRRSKNKKLDDFVSEEDFNEILDKITNEGKSSLTEKELFLLNKYSNQIK